MHSTRHRAFFSELTLDEIVVIEVLLRQIQAAGLSLLRPTGFLIRTTFRTGSGFGWNFRAAVWTNHLSAECGAGVWRIRDSAFRTPHLNHPIPAYSSSVLRLRPMRM